MPLIRIGELSLQLNRKAIKNLHISVLPPDGRVRVSAPEHMTDTAIRMAVVSRIPWIKKQQREFASQPRQSERALVSGECHYFRGKRYRLNVMERAGRHEVKVAGGRIHLFVNPGTSVENRALVLTEFYRTQLKAHIEKLVTDWQCRIGVEAADWNIKKMKTKWGSCNTRAKRIWLNLELAKKPPECVEYILVHELVHLLERNHNERFRAHMDKLMPNWRERRDLLNKLPLAFENWLY
ncbi:M48 family metallopeptidase [Methylomicrobium album]|uniref:Putative metal-dependent hydrolase n=1 Tax=Methylomicrobium album BG8 TaxID=686340 RepID=H8GNP6_METAL|nr:SprT family zinc-dependent metalloprotease [Methylomicrobium album]EIC30802.1 putative metal-dependent hydrolase [Methylomicrobium album BG8]